MPREFAKNDIVGERPPTGNAQNENSFDQNTAGLFLKELTEKTRKLVADMSTDQQVAAVAVVAGVVSLRSQAGRNFARTLAEQIPGVQKLPACYPIETMAIHSGTMPQHLAWSSRQQAWYIALWNPKSKPLPNFTETGFLPPGEHPATWSQVAERFGNNPERQAMLANMQKAVIDLTDAGARKIYLGGSFVTKKPIPNDFDLGWLSNGVPKTARARPEFNVFGSKQKYGGDIFQNVTFEAHYANAIPGGRAIPVQNFLRHNKRAGEDVGVVVLDLRAPIK